MISSTIAKSPIIEKFFYGKVSEGNIDIPIISAHIAIAISTTLKKFGLILIRKLCSTARTPSKTQLETFSPKIFSLFFECSEYSSLLRLLIKIFPELYNNLILKNNNNLLLSPFGWSMMINNVLKLFLKHRSLHRVLFCFAKQFL